MNHRAIPLKSRVRYEGRAQTFDRRATIGADLEKLPDPIWRTVGLVLRSKFTKAAQAKTAEKKISTPEIRHKKSIVTSTAIDK